MTEEQPSEEQPSEEQPPEENEMLEAAKAAFHCMMWGATRKLMIPLAQQGVAEAQYYVGMMLETGRGLDRNIDEALIWWRRAAAQGQREAQFLLGEFAKNEENWEEAYFWLAIVAQHKSSYMGERDFVARNLNPEQLTLVNQRIAEWAPVLEQAPTPEELEASATAEAEAAAAAETAAAEPPPEPAPDPTREDKPQTEQDPTWEDKR